MQANKRPKTNLDVLSGASVSAKRVRAEKTITLIGTYSGKGGVAKTTTTINLAITMVKRLKKKVLLIDVDPTCNMTNFFCPHENTREDIKENEAEVGDVPESPIPENLEPIFLDDTENSEEEDDYVSLLGRFSPEELAIMDKINPTVLNAKSYTPPEQHAHSCNIANILIPIFNGQKEFGEDGIDEIAKKCPRLLEDLLGKDKLFLLRGSPYMMDYEQCVVHGENIRPGQNEAYRHSLGAFRTLLKDLGKKLDVDMVLIDFPPHNSKLIENFIMSCDLILPPCFPDSFSYKALDTFLGKDFPIWIENQKNNVKMQYHYNNECRRRASTMIIEDHLKIHKKPPALFSLLISNYIKYKTVIKEDSHWIHQLGLLFQDLTQKLSKEKVVSYVARDPANPEQRAGYILTCRNVSGLYACMHRLRIPITAMTNDIAMKSSQFDPLNQHSNVKTQFNQWEMAKLISQQYTILASQVHTAIRKLNID